MNAPRRATVRYTVAQAAIQFLGAQQIERDGTRRRFFTACWGIFGHGNVSGIGQALLEQELSGDAAFPYLQGRNEQAMVHAAVAYARQRQRLAAHIVTTSIGPGSTNLVTGAATATINRIPVLLLPSDTFATRVATPVLQELEDRRHGDWSVNDALRPVCTYFDRVQRPEQLVTALLRAMQVLTDPAETGAVTIALPQDVQTEAFDWPADLFLPRSWTIPRLRPASSIVADATTLIRRAERPLIVAGGGVRYSDASAKLRSFVDATGIPVAETQAGKGSLAHSHRLSVGAVGATGSSAANTLAAEADLIIGIGTRFSDFTTASGSAFAADDVRFLNINVNAPDAHKLCGLAIQADARESLAALEESLRGWSTPPTWRTRAAQLARVWDGVIDHAMLRDDARDVDGRPRLVQSAVLGVVNRAMADQDVVVAAAGSIPGDLHRLWRTSEPSSYHVEYGFSCMGYEIPGGIGVRLAAMEEALEQGGAPREVVVLVGDGSYLMMNTELATAVAEDIKLVVLLVENDGFASIGALSESVGSQRFGTTHRRRSSTTGRLDGKPLPVDLALNAASLGVDVLQVETLAELGDAFGTALGATRTTVIHVRTDPAISAPTGGAWWDVPVAQVASIESTQRAFATYREAKLAQRQHLRPSWNRVSEEYGDG